MALTQLILGIGGRGRCCNHVVESGLEGSNILLPHSPVCPRWRRTRAGLYVEEKLLFLSLLSVQPSLLLPGQTAAFSQPWDP